MKPEFLRLQYREVTPDDYELLCLLDESLPKRGTVPLCVVQGLPTLLAQDCEACQCRVCLADLDPKLHIVQLPCRHCFHPSCIAQWLTQCKATCPICTAPLAA